MKAFRGMAIRRTPCCDVLRNELLAVSARTEGRGDISLANPSTQAAVAPRSIDRVMLALAESENARENFGAVRLELALMASNLHDDLYVQPARSRSMAATRSSSMS